MPDDGVKYALLDVGNGNSAVFFKGREAIVVDAPPGETLTRFLIRHQIALVRHLIVTHADKDHAGGAAALIKRKLVERVWMLDDQLNPTDHYDQIVAAMRAARQEGNASIMRGYPHSDLEPLEWSAFKVDWIAPHHEDRMLPGNRNRLSVACRVSVDGDGVALFLGDVDARGFASVSNERDLRADWLVAPHHGGRVGNREQTRSMYTQLLTRTGARYVYFSFGRMNPYGHPSRELVSWLSSEFPDCRIVCSQIAQSCTKEVPERRDVLGAISAGAKRRPITCCAGSIVVDSEEGAEISVSRHQRFASALPTPLCLRVTELSSPELPVL